MESCFINNHYLIIFCLYKYLTQLLCTESGGVTNGIIAYPIVNNVIAQIKILVALYLLCLRSCYLCVKLL